MRKKLQVLIMLFIALVGFRSANAQTQTKWKPHDRNRPAPVVVEPGTPSTENGPGRPPADAVVLEPLGREDVDELEPHAAREPAAPETLAPE